MSLGLLKRRLIANRSASAALEYSIIVAIVAADLALILS
jgi:Flp pilus assembly pilin Flp